LFNDILKDLSKKETREMKEKNHAVISTGLSFVDNPVSMHYIQGYPQNIRIE